MPKQPFDVRSAVVKLRKAVEPYPKAALFELVSEGFDSVFEVLVACIISIRTRDETTIPVAKQLFARARTPKAIARLSVDQIDELISASTFHRGKAGQIHAIAERTVAEFEGVLPCDSETLQMFQGVGPKCANLAVGIVCGQALIGVDVHVHRVTNRWGIVVAPTPEKTMVQLQEQLAKRYWVEINALLVPFGKHVCTAKLPKCSTCPLLAMCGQVGVTSHR